MTEHPRPYDKLTKHSSVMPKHNIFNDQSNVS